MLLPHRHYLNATLVSYRNSSNITARLDYKIENVKLKLIQLSIINILSKLFRSDGPSSSTTSTVAVPRKHIIQVSTYQMCILMLFNSRDKLTYEVSQQFNTIS